MSLTDHFGATPSEICASIISELSIFIRQSGSGCVGTIKRIPPDDLSIDGLKRHIASGLPAFLVAHNGGRLASEGVSKRSHYQRCTVSIVCVAENARALADRFSGDTPTTRPGIDDLADWAYYYGIRGLENAKRAGKRMLLAPSLVESSWLHSEPGSYAMQVDLEYIRPMNCWEDDPTTTLQTLGLCHDPTDIDSDWFDIDNETPLSDWPSTVDGGVTDL